MTYLEIVNDVLVRLREKEVNSVTANSYSKLIGKYVNDIKTQVENSYNWNSLTTTITVPTSNNVYNYVLTGAGTQFKVMDVINDTDNITMRYVDNKKMNEYFLEEPLQYGNPEYYNFNGTQSGDVLVDVYPIPNKASNLRFNLFVPQDKLSANSDVILVPDDVVALGAYAKAIVERGEDAGMQSSEAWQLYRSALSDAIAIESGQFPNELNWYAE
jgi:hypothetical protein